MRAEPGLTQAQVAERAEVSKQGLSLYERERQGPHLDTLGRILDAREVRLVDRARQPLSDEEVMGAAIRRRA